MYGRETVPFPWQIWHLICYTPLMKWLAFISAFMPSVGLADANVEETDVLEFRQGPVWPEIYYSNSGDQTSKSVYDKVMTFGGIEVVVNIKLGSPRIPGAERIIVESPDGMVTFEVPTMDPPDQGPYAEVDVKDGDYVVIYVKPPLF